MNYTLSSAATSVRLDVIVEGVGPVWTSPLTTSVTFLEAGGLKLWSPWDRGESKDALAPSDGGFSWWNGLYALGAVISRQDFVVAEHVSILDPTKEVGLSFVGDPRDLPSPEAWMNLTGKGGAQCTRPLSCRGPASFSFSYHMLRLQPGVVHRRGLDIIAHPDSSWRTGLRWSVGQYTPFWGPTFPQAQAVVDGLGSYSSYLGNLTQPKWKQMAYQTSWDLSGRFFPYMGMFLPPMPSKTATWLNDPEGSQTRANCSYSSIDKYYAATQEETFATLSYFNVFEYGINILSDPAALPSKPASGLNGLNEANWQNATQYLRDNFPDAMVTEYACAYGSPCASRAWASHRGAQYSWQKSVVVDPHVGLGYDVSLLSQVRRKLVQLPHFQGLVVDRSDWNQLVNLRPGADDGYTLVKDRVGYSFKHGYLQILAAVRKVLDADPTKPKVMLDNTLGYCWLPFMHPFDGSFSEGNHVNAVGLLGLRSTAILWTENGECCNPAKNPDQFFQRRLRMGVFPMAPFPLNDHSITPNPAADEYYVMYGPLFNALRNTTWVLDVANPIEVSPAVVKANAFRGGRTGEQLLYPLMLGGNATSCLATLNRLPLSPSNMEFAVLWPGRTWKPVTAKAIGEFSAQVNVTLMKGCALLRATPAA